MTDVMMSWGTFKFNITGAAYNDIKRTTEYEWAAQKLIGKPENLQFTGFGPETFTLSGHFFTAITKRYGIMDDVRTLAAKKKPQLLVAGTGDVLGKFVVKRVEESASTFYQAGVPRRVDFSLDFEKYGEAPKGGSI